MHESHVMIMLFKYWFREAVMLLKTTVFVDRTHCFDFDDRIFGKLDWQVIILVMKWKFIKPMWIIILDEGR